MSITSTKGPRLPAPGLALTRSSRKAPKTFASRPGSSGCAATGDSLTPGPTGFFLCVTPSALAKTESGTPAPRARPESSSWRRTGSDAAESMSTASRSFTARSVGSDAPAVGILSRSVSRSAGHAAIAACPALLETLLERIPTAGASDPTERAVKLREAVDILSAASDPVLRHELLSGLARGAGVPLSVLAKAEGVTQRKNPVGPGVRESPVAAQPELPGREAKVLRAFLEDLVNAKPGAGSLGPLVEVIDIDLFTHPIAKEILVALRECWSQSGTLDFSSLSTHLGADAGLVAAQLLSIEDSLRAEGAVNEGSEGLSRIQIPLLQLKIRLLEETAENLQPEILKAASTGDLPATRRKQELVEEIRRLKAELRAENARRI